MESIHTWQGTDNHKILSVVVRPADLTGAIVLTEEELEMVVGGIRQDSDPCEGGEGQMH